MRKILSVWLAAEGNVQVLAYIFHIPRPIKKVCTLLLNLYGIKTQNRWFGTRNDSSFYGALPRAVSWCKSKDL
jgi:hypothetical protein